MSTIEFYRHTEKHFGYRYDTTKSQLQSVLSSSCTGNL